jgi:hypothetical protein
MKSTFSVLAAALMLSSCRGPEVDKPGAASQTIRAGDATAAQPAPVVPAPAASQSAPSKIVIAGVAPGVLYVCVTEAAGQTRQATIEFSAQVAELCRKAPEMGPCQYEREACRRTGGRVFAADGTEVTLGTEAEYDKRVMRIRMKSN